MSEIRAVTDEGTLEACYDTGEGTIRFTEKFAEEDSLFQADVIKDWIGILQRYYDDIELFRGAL